MHFEAAHAKRRSLGLTPLIDVVFLLLIFFMLATRFGGESELALRVDRNLGAATAGVAEVTAGKPSDPRVDLVVLLDGAGDTWIEAERVDAALLRSQLTQRLASQPDGHITVAAEGSVSVQRIAETLRHASDAGARVVSIARAR